MPGFLFLHLCFSLMVSEPLQCYQRARILHSFAAHGAAMSPKYAPQKITPVEIQMCLVQFSVNFFCLFTFLASFKVLLLYRGYEFLGDQLCRPRVVKIR